MFTQSVIQECLIGLVGVFQPDDPVYPRIDDSLTASTSGLMLQNTHPLCTIENIFNSAPEFNSFEYEAWSDSRAYSKGAIVLNEGKTYEARAAIAANVAEAPNATPTSWKAVSPFSEWIKRVYGQACSNLMLTIAREKKLQEAGRTLLESQQLYQGPGSINDKIIKRGRFVGFMIDLKQADGLTLRIDRIGLQSDTAQELEFYLYNSSQDEPVAVFPIVTTRINTFAWQAVENAIISYMGKETDSDSSWYFGYYEDDIAGQIIGKTMNFGAPCSTCDSYNISAYNRWSKYSSITAIEVPEASTYDDRTLFDVSDVRANLSTNWGMNLSISVLCDISSLACNNKMIVADALAMQFAMEFLQHIAFSTRTGVIADKTKKLAMAELDSDEKSGSFKVEYFKAVRALKLDLSGLNSICLPCSTKGKITSRAI